jgi:hypothetical protein
LSHFFSATTDVRERGMTALYEAVTQDLVDIGVVLSVVGLRPDLHAPHADLPSPSSIDTPWRAAQRAANAWAILAALLTRDALARDDLTRCAREIESDVELSGRTDLDDIYERVCERANVPRRLATRPRPGPAPNAPKARKPRTP